MCSTGLLPAVRQALDYYRENSGDSQVAFVQLPEMTSKTAGSRDHPGPLLHRQAADVLVTEIGRLIQ
jgi:hypothetical protein